MSFQYLADASGRPSWHGLLPGAPAPYFLQAGEGEHAKLFGDTFSVLVSGDETEGQFGMFVANCPAGDVIPTHAHTDTHETFFVLDGAVRVFVEDREGTQTSRLLQRGDFGFVPAGLAHAYRVERAAQMVGVSSGHFERFFQHMGALADRVDPDSPPYLPKPEQMGAAAQRHNMEFMPEHTWPDA